MELSAFGKRFSRDTGARRLMEDLGRALAGNGEVLMLGGGNPAHIPEVEALLRARMHAIVEQGEVFARMIGDYDAPQGEQAFIEALAELLRRTFGWDVGPANVALTTGSQSGFFMLFNMLAGEFESGGARRILLPVTPEYVGYADLGLTDDFFVARRPTIELLDGHLFKYHVDFEALEVDDSIGAICVSRPTNPTGNVVTDREIAQLDRIATARGVPLIIDNAYGAPFPNIIFTDATLAWNENIILCMSLSKIGLPGARTGIVIAREEIIEALASINAVMSLATNSVGAVLLLDLVRSGRIIEVCRELITPYYRTRAAQAVELIQETFEGLEYRIHKPEGAIFLWLWLPGLRVTAAELYARLKRRGVLVLPGHYFFPGLREPWQHAHECIRLTYAQRPEVVSAGIRIVAEEVRGAQTAA
jgi:valine--pyruvate aminotransferase